MDPELLVRRHTVHEVCDFVAEDKGLQHSSKELLDKLAKAGKKEEVPEGSQGTVHCLPRPPGRPGTFHRPPGTTKITPLLCSDGR